MFYIFHVLLDKFININLMFIFFHVLLAYMTYDIFSFFVKMINLGMRIFLVKIPPIILQIKFLGIYDYSNLVLYSILFIKLTKCNIFNFKTLVN